MNDPLKILIADDDNLNRILLSKLIQKFGVECETAPNGSEALSVFELSHFDAVFLDINMPVMSGPECASEIIRIAPDRKPLLVCISADEKGPETSMFDYFLLKPFNTDEIRDLLDALTSALKSEMSYDFEEVIRIIGLDKETMQMLMDEFFSVMTEELENLKKAVAERNSDMITHVAHKMKGAAAGMMVENLRNLCSEMQNVNKSDIRLVRLLLVQIGCCFSRFRGLFTK